MKYGAASQIVIMEFNQEEKKLQVLNRVEIIRGDFTLDNAVNKIIELNYIYQPVALYIDRGFGEYQIEILRKYGMENPESNLAQRIRPVAFGESKELIDPFTKEIVNKPIKPFMVNQAQLLFERDKFIINSNDEMIVRQLENYQVVKKTVSGQPVFTSEDEHALDCMMLCVLGFTEKCNDLLQTLIDFKPAKTTATLSLKMNNLIERGVISHYQDVDDDDDYMSKWDEPGTPPPIKVMENGRPCNRTKRSYLSSWNKRGSNLKKPVTRPKW